MRDQLPGLSIRSCDVNLGLQEVCLSVKQPFTKDGKYGKAATKVSGLENGHLVY